MKCRLLRLRISSRLDDGRPLPSALERHLSKCPDCAAWHRTGLSLIGQLRHSAPDQVRALPDPSPFLHAKILRAVRVSRQRPEPAAVPLGRIWRGAAVAAVVLTVAAGSATMFLKHKAPAPAPTGGTAQSAPGVPLQISPTSPGIARVSGKNNNPLLRAAAGLDQPLRREMALLGEDARTALMALKTGFLPDGWRPE